MKLTNSETRKPQALHVFLEIKLMVILDRLYMLVCNNPIASSLLFHTLISYIRFIPFTTLTIVLRFVPLNGSYM